MLGLAFAYLRDRSLTTALNVLLLGLAVATLVILLLFSSQLGSRFDKDAQGIDLVVGAKGSPLQLILSSIYQIDTPTGNIPLSSVELLRKQPTVAKVIPLALGDNFRGFRIVGTEQSFLDLRGATIAQGRMFSDHAEAVIGSDVSKKLGMKVGQKFVGNHGLGDGDGDASHDQHPFIAVGIMTPTGTVADRLILVSVESVWDVHGIEHDEHEEGHHEESHHEVEGHADENVLKPEVTALLVKYKSTYGALTVPMMVNRQTEMQAAVPAVETARLLSLLGVGIDGARLFAWLLAFTGGLSIFVALLNAASAREGDLALLRVMGAKRSAVFGTILIEGLLTAAAGTALGLLLGHGALAVAVNSFAQLGDIGIDPFAFHPGELVIVAAVLGIGLLAALIPAWRVFRSDLAATLARSS